ncbi:MAG: FAD:protein FMN transferase [Lachnospiraceae bacterium]
MKHLRLMSIIVLFSIFTSGCSQSPTNEPISKNGMFFDTVISVTLYDSTDESILNGCMELCKEYEEKFSKTIATSEISRINQGAGKPVTVSDDTIALLEKGLYYGELSHGSFDITIAPLSDLWNFKDNKGVVPGETDIKEALSHVDYRNISIQDHTVTLKDPQSAIDLGGIAKGYIADQLKDYLKKQGVKHALINLGGNVLAVGNKSNHTNFQIGIQKPFDKKNEPITSIAIDDQSMVSSGVYERYFKVNNTLYHHILNPNTGFPYQNDLLGVTILSEKSVDGDGLSTTCFTLGLEKGLSLINSLDHTEAVFITNDYQLHYSDGWKE